MNDFVNVVMMTARVVDGGVIVAYVAFFDRLFEFVVDVFVCVGDVEVVLIEIFVWFEDFCDVFVVLDFVSGGRVFVSDSFRGGVFVFGCFFFGCVVCV